MECRSAPSFLLGFSFSKEAGKVNCSGTVLQPLAWFHPFIQSCCCWLPGTPHFACGNCSSHGCIPLHGSAPALWGECELPKLVLCPLRVVDGIISIVFRNLTYALCCGNPYRCSSLDSEDREGPHREASEWKAGEDVLIVGQQGRAGRIMRVSRATVRRQRQEVVCAVGFPCNQMPFSEWGAQPFRLQSDAQPLGDELLSYAQCSAARASCHQCGFSSARYCNACPKHRGTIAKSGLCWVASCTVPCCRNEVPGVCSAHCAACNCPIGSLEQSVLLEDTVVVQTRECPAEEAEEVVVKRSLKMTDVFSENLDLEEVVKHDMGIVQWHLVASLRGLQGYLEEGQRKEVAFDIIVKLEFHAEVEIRVWPECQVLALKWMVAQKMVEVGERGAAWTDAWPVLQLSFGGVALGDNVVTVGELGVESGAVLSVRVPEGYQPRVPPDINAELRASWAQFC